MNSQARHLYKFGPFRLDPTERLLTRDGVPVPLTPKAFETLVLLAERSGHLVEKDELMRKIWPDAFVEEVGLARNISVLRKVLGDGYIETVPRGGYRFVASVRELPDNSTELLIAKRTRSSVVIEEDEEANGQEVAEALIEVSQGDNVKWWKKRRSLLLTLAGCVTVIGLAFGAFYSWASSKSEQPEAPEIGAAAKSTAKVKSIAVLPFKPLVANSRDESLEMGMAHTLITRLSNIKQIMVRPMSAVRKYTGLEQDPVAAGRDLGVESVLDGDIQKSAERIRVTVRLVSVRDGSTLWADKFDESFTNIFDVEESISSKVVSALALKLTGKEKERLAKRYTENTDAYELYLRGGFLMDKSTAEGFKRAGECYQKAIYLDPNYAPAYVGLAHSIFVPSTSGYQPLIAPRDAYPKAIEYLNRALELDEDLAEAHGELAFIKAVYGWDWSSAEEEYRQAIYLNPNDAGSYFTYAWVVLTPMGRFDEAFAMIEQARRVDPLYAMQVPNTGRILYFARRYDEAIEFFHKFLEPDLYDSWPRKKLIDAYERKEMFGEAIAEEKKLGTPQEIVAELGQAYSASGASGYWQQRRRQWSKELSKGAYVSPYYSAVLLAQLGEKDKAFKELEKGYEQRLFQMIFLKVEPKLDSLRSDPRFKDLLQRMGLTY